MEFWGSEVKSGETLKVSPGEDRLLHLSQASLGEVKKGKSNDSVYVSVKVDGKKLVLGTLSHDKLPQQQLDLVFDRDFELSHTLKGGSVYFFGYKESNMEDEDVEDYSDFDMENEDMPLSLENIAKPVTKVKEEKPVGAKKVNKDSSADKKVSVEVANGKPEIEDDDSSDGDYTSDENEVDMDGDESDDDSEDADDDDSEDEEDESDEEEPAKVVPGNKKRVFDTVAETKKKLKVTTAIQEKTGGGVKAASPSPSKQAGKKAPKSRHGGGTHVCRKC